MIGYIYKWTNKVTNKNYIGKTNSLQTRYGNFILWDVHYAGPHIDRARQLYNDLKYWDYSILYSYETNDRKDLRAHLDEKEVYYINLYQSNDKEKGYNISSGGTWGDTFAALTDEERDERMSKFKKTHKLLKYRWMNDGVQSKKIKEDEQQEYLDKGWVYGMSEKYKENFRKGQQEYLKSDSFKQRHELAIKLKKERELENQEKHKKYMEEWHNSEEYKQKIEKNKENRSQRLIEYNKSEEHRKSAIESNKRRWKDGCPQETREQISKSRKEFYKTHKYRHINKDGVHKMIDSTELQKYINDGWKLGTGKPAWNKRK